MAETKNTFERDTDSRSKHLSVSLSMPAMYYACIAVSYGMGQHIIGIWYSVSSMVFNVGHARSYARGHVGVGHDIMHGPWT